MRCKEEINDRRGEAVGRVRLRYLYDPIRRARLVPWPIFVGRAALETNQQNYDRWADRLTSKQKSPVRLHFKISGQGKNGVLESTPSRH